MMDTQRLSPAPGWTTSSGELRLAPPAGALESSGAVDRLLIVETANRYAWAYDERTLDVLAACFTPDAVWSGSVAEAVQIEPIRGRQAIVDWLAAHMASQTDQRRHSATNVIVGDQTSTTATALAYLVLTKAENGVASLVCTGVYRFSMVKEPDDVWRVSELWAGFDTPF